MARPNAPLAVEGCRQIPAGRAERAATDSGPAAVSPGTGLTATGSICVGQYFTGWRRPVRWLDCADSFNSDSGLLEPFLKPLFQRLSVFV